MKPKPPSAAKTTIDTVTTSIGMLWDWLGRDPNATQEKTDENAAEKARQLPEGVETEGHDV